MTEPQLLQTFQALQRMRATVNRLDDALSLLTPQERVVANFLLLNPGRGNIQQVCQLLHVEQPTVYRYRRRVLKKLAAALEGMENAAFRMKD